MCGGVTYSLVTAYSFAGTWTCNDFKINTRFEQWVPSIEKVACVGGNPAVRTWVYCKDLLAIRQTNPTSPVFISAEECVVVETNNTP